MATLSGLAEVSDNRIIGNKNSKDISRTLFFRNCLSLYLKKCKNIEGKIQC